MNDRLKQFIEYLGISTRGFEQKISVSNGLIARFLSKNTTIQSDVLSKICDTFPGLNPDWLLTGKGKMLRTSEVYHPSGEDYSASDNHMQSLIDILNRTLSEKDKQISQLLEIIKNFSSSEANGK